MSESLHLTRNGSILEITLDRPKANAIDAKTSFEMGEVFLNFRDDPQLRVAIITGAGEKFFSAGWFCGINRNFQSRQTGYRSCERLCLWWRL